MKIDFPICNLEPADLYSAKIFLNQLSGTSYMSFSLAKYVSLFLNIFSSTVGHFNFTISSSFKIETNGNFHTISSQLGVRWEFAGSLLGVRWESNWVRFGSLFYFDHLQLFYPRSFFRIETDSNFHTISFPKAPNDHPKVGVKKGHSSH